MTRLFRIQLCVLAALGVTSCLGRGEPIVTTQIQVVKEPVAVPCIRPDQVPRQPSRLIEDGPVPDTLTEMVARLRAKLLVWQDWFGPTAEELLKSCSKLEEAPNGATRLPAQ